MKQKDFSALSLIFISVFVDLLGFGILIPILPTFATKELFINEAAIGVVIAAYSFVQFIFNPIFGKISDKYGRKKIIVICLFLNALGYVLFAYTHSYAMLLLSRIVAGIGGSSIAVAQAYIADITTPQNRSRGMGMIGAAFGLGFVFGPLIGGLLSKYGYYTTGMASAFFSFAAFILTIKFLPEPELRLDKNYAMSIKLFDVKSFSVLFKRTDLSLLVILFFILTFSIANIYGTFALLGFKIYNFSDRQNGYMYAVLGLTSAVVQGFLISRISKYLSSQKIVTLGTICLIIGLGMLPFGRTFSGLTLIIIILSLGTGSLQPTLLSLISEFSSDAEQGIVLGVNQSLSALARVLGPLWGGFAFEFLGYAFPFLTGAFFGLIILIIALKYLPKVLKKIAAIE